MSMHESGNQDGPLGHDHRRARRPEGAPSLGRASKPMVLGVAGGVAEYIGANPTTVRWLWFLSLPLSGGLSGVAYLVLAALLKANPAADETAGG
jgi:phage shock protein PspC (stress-responsive transcriptional regulator)